MQRVLFVVLVCLLPMGCSLQQISNNQLANQLHSNAPSNVLAELASKSPDSTDIAQYYLNLGYLQLITGDFNSSIDSFSKAQTTMQSLQATSISENLAAGTINETFRQYSGSPTDLVMIHNMLALSYLFSGDVYGARVEMLQADVEMKKLASNKHLYGQLASTHLLSGIIYELLDERSSSFISYRFSEELLEKRKMAVPVGLKLALLRMSESMGNEEQFQRYQKKYPNFINQHNKDDKQLFFIYFDGVVSNKVEKSVMVPSYDNEQLIRISMPSYPPNHYHPQYETLQSGENKVSSEMVENIELLARDDLSKDYPAILAMTTSRAVAKYQLVKKANEQDSFVGALVNIATVISEVADVRSWNMLPSSWQFSYLETDLEQVQLLRGQQNLQLQKSKQHLILASSLTNNLFHYQQ